MTNFSAVIEITFFFLIYLQTLTEDMIRLLDIAYNPFLVTSCEPTGHR